MVQALVWTVVMSMVFLILGFVVVGILTGLGLINNTSVVYSAYSYVTGSLTTIAQVLVAVIALFAIFALLRVTGMMGGGGRGK